MNKYLLFLQDVVSDDRLIKWLEGRKYKVVYEADDHYILPDQNCIKCGIDKQSENILYEVVYHNVQSS